MPVTLVVMSAGAAALAAAILLARRAPDVDTTDAEDHVVRTAERSPVVVRFVRRFSRRIVGSTFVGAAFLLVLGLATAAGVVFDMLESETGFARFDTAVADWGAANATGASTTALSALTQLGSSIGVIAIGVIVGWREWERRHDGTPAVFLAVVYGGHAAISNLLKLIVDRDRPDVEHLVGTVSSSFPSTHSGTAAAMWAAFALVLSAGRNRWARTALSVTAISVAVAVAASRALLGVHWLTDVIAGAAIGWAWFLLVAIAFGGRLLRFGEPKERMDRHASEVRS